MRLLGPICHGVLACALVGAACDRQPAAATPAALLHRDAAPLGGPVDVTLRFYPLRPPPAGHYRVRLRCLFEDGKVMLSDDHDPPVPTDQWQVGRTIMYARRLFLPELPYVGDVSVVVGLSVSSSSGSEERLPLHGRDVRDRLYEVARLKVHARRTLLAQGSGWHRPYDPASLPRYGWTEATATLRYRNPRQDSILHLRISGHPEVKPSQQATLTLAGRVVYTTMVTPDETDHEVTVHADTFGSDNEGVLTIAVDRTTFGPVRRGGARVRREFGIQVHHVSLEPLVNRPSSRLPLEWQPTLTFQLSDAAAAELTDPIVYHFNYRPTLPDGTPNPETRAAIRQTDDRAVDENRVLAHRARTAPVDQTEPNLRGRPNGQQGADGGAAE